MSNENLDYWRLLDDLTVIDAAILMTGNNPSEKEQCFDNEDEMAIYNSDGSYKYIQKTDYKNFAPAFKALRNAIFSNKLSAVISFNARENINYPIKSYLVDEEYYDMQSIDLGDGETTIDFDMLIRSYGHTINIMKLNQIDILKSSKSLCILKEPNWNNTTIDVDDLKAWLESRSFFPEFFFPNATQGGFKDKTHVRYSPKLACAIAAWDTVKKAQPNKSVKESIAAWVQSNGVNFGIGGSDGIVSQKAIEQIATVVNWNTKGGATPTSSSKVENPQEIENYDKVDDDFDIIPF